MPVRRVGPLTTRGAVSAGLRVLSSVCTASNSAAWMIAGTAISTTSVSGLPRAFSGTSIEPVAADVGRPRQHLVHRAESRVRMPAALR